MSHCKRRNEGEGEKKKKSPPQRVRRRWGGLVVAARLLAGGWGVLTPSWPEGPRVPLGPRTPRPHIVRGCMEQWQLLFGRDLASCVS